MSLASLACAGDQALAEIFRLAPDLPVIVHHPDGSIDDVIHLTRRGAFYVLVGEADPESLAAAVDKAVRQGQSRLQSAPERAPWRHFVVGQSRAILQVCEVISLVAAKRCTILISGETGTGKEVIAKAIHAASTRATMPLISVNCTALPANLIETELFGHAKGAFTGAIASRVGRFEQAHRSSLFLDEIGDLPLEAQAKLLRVLQEQEFQRVGSSETVRVDVRVIAASNIDLEQAIRDRRFREDLYYRLNVVPIQLPPLRERRDDIPLLLQHFLHKIRAAENSGPKQISDEAVEYLQKLEWPGNVRQLEHALQMAFALSGDRCVLCPNDFISRRVPGLERALGENPPLVQLPLEGLNFDEVVGTFELSLLNQALTISGGNKARAADLLKIKRTTLLAKMKSLNQQCGTLIQEASNTAAAGISPPGTASLIPVTLVNSALVCEADEAVRKFISTTLERAGISVISAACASEAADMLGCWKSQIGLLITRPALSPQNAELSACAHHFRQYAPGLRIIFLVDGQTERTALPGQPGTQLLPRLFSPSDLLAALGNLATDESRSEIPTGMSA